MTTVNDFLIFRKTSVQRMNEDLAADATGQPAHMTRFFPRLLIVFQIW
jgi:hypothetical protein